MPSLQKYQEFLAQRKADLRRIANTTRREAELDDIEQEGWIAANTLEKRRGHFFDFGNRNSQEYVIGYLHNEFVKFAEKTNRYATSIEQDEEDGWNADKFVSRLGLALSDSDPLSMLQAKEEDGQVSLSRAQSLSYSEAVAYALLLARFNGEEAKLADFLRIHLATLRQRINRAIALLKVQPTLFDRVDIIDRKFLAKQERPNVRRKSDSLEEQQAFWEA